MKLTDFIVEDDSKNLKKSILTIDNKDLENENDDWRNLTYTAINISNCENLDFEHKKFPECTGTVLISHSDLTSLEGFPKQLNNSLILQGNKIKTLKGTLKKLNNRAYDGINLIDNELENLNYFPEVNDGLKVYLRYNKIKDITGIPKNINSLDISYNPLEKIPNNFDGFDNLNTLRTSVTSLKDIHKIKTCIELLISGNVYIKEGGLGLLKIKNLWNVETDNIFDTDFLKALKIIEKYLAGKKGDVCTNTEILKCKAELEREGLGQFAIL